MRNFRRHEIPIDIQELEFQKKTACMDVYTNLVSKMREDEDSYIEALSSMVYMEEAANGRGAMKYNIHKVNIEIMSQIDHKVKIKIVSIQYVIQ